MRPSRSTRIALRLGVLLGVLWLGALAGPARADVVSLDDGRQLEGTVVEETDKVVRLRVNRGQGTAVIELPRASVVSIQKGGPDPQKLHADATTALGQGDREGALKILRRLVGEQPTDALLRRELAFAELMGEDLAAARDDYSRAVALDGTNVEALMGLGYVSRRLGERDTAISAYRSATRSGPQHPEAWRALAELLLERDGRGDRDEAVDAARRALKVAPADGRNALLAADALGRATGVGAREEHLAALAILEGFARDHSTEALAPRVVERAAALATRLEERERAHAAVAGFVAARPTLDDATRARVLALDALYTWLAASRPAPPLGLDVAADGLDLEAASRRIDVALELAPAEGELLLLRARVEARGGHFLEGSTDAAKARDLLAAGEARDDAGLVSTFLQRLARDAAAAPGTPAPRPEPLALDVHRRLAALLPFTAAAHEDLARALESAGELESARDAFERARTRAPEADRERLAHEVERVEKLRALRERNKDL